MLNDREQAMLRRLAVFAGWFSIPAAQAIGTGHPIEPGAVVDSLTALVDKSLLQPALREGRARYRLLEVVRQFSRARLDAAGETQEVRRRHATWVVAEAERRAPLLFGTQVVDVLDDLERDLDDIRAASAWASRAGDHELALRMLATPWLLWLCRYPAEGRQRIEEALEASDRAPPHVLARAHVVAGWLDLRASRTETSQAHALQALALGEEIRAPAVRAQARTLLGWNAMFLAPATAESVLMEAEAETRAVDDQQHHAWALAGLGFISAHHGRPDDALDYLGRSLMVARKAGDWVGIRRALGLSGVLLAVRGSFDEAGAKFEECEQITRGLCDRYFLAQALEYRGFISLHRGDLEDAQRRIEESLSVARQSSAVALCRSQTMMALFHLALGEFDVAVAQAEQVLETVRVSGLNWHFSMAFAVAAEAYRRASRSDEAERIRQEGVTRAREAGLAWAEALSEAAGDRPVNLMRGIDGLARLSHAPELIRTLEALAIAVGSAERDSDDYAEATLLLSGTAAARRRLRLVAFPVDRAPLAQMAERLQDLLGANWEDVQERGAAMSLDDLARRVLRMRGPRRRPPSGWESLTPTERRVAELAAEGLRNAEIAERLFVAPGTVKVHLSHIFSKLGARTRTELSAIYARVGRR